MKTCIKPGVLTLLTLFITAVLITSPALASDDKLTAIKAAGVLKVAVPQDFPPFGSVGSDMKPAGYDIDTARLIAEKLGVELKLVPVTSTNRIPYLTTGKVDIIISSLGKNPDRAKVIDFSDAYAPFFNGVFGLKSLDVSGPEDLAGKVIAVTRGSIEDLELTKVAPASLEIKRFEDNASTIAAYKMGQVDLTATGNVVAASLNEKNPAKMLVTKFVMKNSPCYVGIGKEQPSLMAAVNGIIAAAKTDGSLNVISEKWLHNELPTDL